MPLLLLSLVLFAGSPAWARDGGEFRRHYRQALRLYQQRRFQASISEFEVAYNLRQLPRLLFNIGQAHRKLGNARQVVDTFQAYLDAEAHPPAQLKKEAEDAIAQAQAQLAAAERLRRSEEPKEAARAAPPLEPSRLALVPPAASPAQRPVPVYKKWWFWTVIGVAAAGVVAGATAGGILLTRDNLDVRKISF